MNVDLSMCASSGEAAHRNSSTGPSVNVNVRRLQVCIVKATRLRRETGSADTGLLWRLEPDEAKVSCPVLRGGGGCKATSLPDPCEPLILPVTRLGENFHDRQRSLVMMTVQ